MNWAPLLLAVALGTPAAVMFVRGKSPRGHAIFAALAVLCLLAGVPSLLAWFGRPIPPGPFLVGVVALAIVSAMFFWLDVIRGEHKKPLTGRRGGSAAAAGQGGSPGRANHHVRPLVSSVGLVLSGLLIAFNAGALGSTLSHGFTQTWSTVTHHRVS